MVNFEVLYLEEASTFIESINEKVLKKMLYNISKAQKTNDLSLFKKLKGTNIWEFRVKYATAQYRLFAFWDTDKKALVVCTHGIVKKTQKTPKKEIEKAEQIRKQYLGL